VLLNRTPDVQDAIVLFPLCDEVGDVNEEKVKGLETEAIEYTSHDHFEMKQNHTADELMQKLSQKSETKTLALELVSH
jgi:hypothetical protein